MIVYIPQEKVSRWFSPKFKIFITTISFKFLCVGFKKIKNCFIYYLLKKKMMEQTDLIRKIVKSI